MTPQPGDRWEKDGRDPLVVTEVTDTHVTITGPDGPVTCTIYQYHEMADASLASGARFTPAAPAALTGSANTHARLAPSSSKRWSTCTGSVAYLEANAHRLPKDTGSIYASEGTEAHEWAAKLLLGQCEARDIPEDFRDPVTLYHDHCMALVPTGVKPQIETKVDLFYQPDQYGTVDFAIVTEERVTIRDYKHGAGVLVESDSNTQLAVYAFSLITMMDGIYDFTDDTLVDIGVVQPRHREAHLSEPWIVSLGQLREFCEGLRYAAIQATTGLERVRAKVKGLGTRDISAAEILEAAPGLRFAPGDGDDGACRWCPAKAFCEIRLNQGADQIALGTVSGESLITLMPDLTKEEKALPVMERIGTRFGKMGVPLEALTDDYLVRMFAAKKWIESCLGDVAEYLEGRVLAGDSIPGLKLVDGRAGNRTWCNEAAADTFLRGQKLKEDERYDQKLKSPAAIEKLLAKKLKESVRTRTRFEALIERSAPKKTLALDTDRREAVPALIQAMPVIEEGSTPENDAATSEHPELDLNNLDDYEV